MAYKIEKLDNGNVHVTDSDIDSINYTLTPNNQVVLSGTRVLIVNEATGRQLASFTSGTVGEITSTAGGSVFNPSISTMITQFVTYIFIPS